ncbi:hypothetical protein SRHO_G00317530 [Serrasalmus rhombeus]
MSSGKLRFPDISSSQALTFNVVGGSVSARLGSGHSDLKTCDEPRRTPRCRITPLKSARSRLEIPRSRGIS